MARVLVNGEVLGEQAFPAGHPEAIVFDLLPALTSGDNDVRVVLEADTALPWSCELAYHTDQPADDPVAQVSIRTSLAETLVQEGAPVALGVELQNLTDRGLPMTMAAVGLPAGLEITNAVLDDLKEGGSFDLWERRGREILLYWRGLAPGAEKSITMDLLARVPGRTAGPASSAYLYYTPDAKRWAAPLTVEVQAVR